MTECLQQKKWVKVCTWLIIWWTKVWKLVLCRAPLQFPSRFSCVDPSTPSQHHQPNNFKNIFQFSKNLAIFKSISKYFPPPLTTMNPIIVKISFNCQNIVKFSKYLALFKYISKYLPPPLNTIHFQNIFQISNILPFSNTFENIFHLLSPPWTQ